MLRRIMIFSALLLGVMLPSFHGFAPVCSVLDFYLKHDVVGGKFTRGENQSNIANTFARRIINGKRGSDFSTLTNSANHLMFENKQLQGLHSLESTLPEDSNGINGPTSFDWKHRAWIWGLAAFILFQSAIIFWLVIIIARCRQIQRALRKSEREKDLILGTISELVTCQDRSMCIVWANRAAADYVGIPIEDLIGKHCYQVWQGRDEVCDDCAVERAIESGENQESEVTTPEGQVWHTRGYLVRDEEGGITGAVEVSRDVTEQKKVEEALRASEQKFRILAENIPGVIYLCRNDERYTMLYLNDAVLELTGYAKEEFLADRISFVELYHPGDAESIAPVVDKALDDGRPFRLVYRLKHADGSWRWIEEVGAGVFRDGKLKFLEGVLMDITDRKHAEEQRKIMEAQLRHHQKLESLGTMASGVAHEINNPVNGIMNLARLITSHLDPDDRLQEYAELIIEESDRIASIVRNLLAFSRQDQERHSPADIGDIVNKTLSLIRSAILKDRIDLIIEIPEDLPRIKCRSQQIQQVLMNLIANARDALNERYPGYDEGKILKISAGVMDNDDGKWIRTMIEDRGIGIDAKIIERIFDPFFTAKARNEGTGLGLSISYGIVKEHYGALSVESIPFQYTRFYLDLRVDNGWSIHREVQPKVED